MNLSGFWSPAFTLDGVSAPLLTLVLFISMVVVKFSIRYLDGERNRGRYFAWFGWTVASVILLVVSGNLLWTAIGWMSISFGLHHLLTHYSDRPDAIRAAWMKFFTSRIGDAALIGALILIWAHYQTLNLSDLLTEMDGGNIAPSIGPIGVLLVIAAMTKSAMFPFHAWLPETLQTPTPVSALMHAGIVNAGGYLIIRTSPIIVHAPGAMLMLAIVGTLTACFAATVMLTQTNIKKQLAYSTIAQMGLMMLQCGLGAFSAAMLHLIAHSLYKAHAFLSSGNVVAESKGLRSIQLSQPLPGQPTVKLNLCAIAISLACMAFISWGFELLVDRSTHSMNAWILVGLMVLGLSRWLSSVLTIAIAEPTARVRLISAGVLGTFAMCMCYQTAYWVVSTITARSIPANVTLSTSTWWAVSSFGAFAFLGLFLLEHGTIHGAFSRRFAAFYVHASNGFYIPAMTKILIRSLQT